MSRIQQTWLRQAQTEYMAASLVSEMTHWLITLGVAPELLMRATHVVADELRHATICRELFLHAGGKPGPVELRPQQLVHRDDPDAPVRLRAITAAGELACEETVALTVFRMRLHNAKDPVAREVCKTILREEATHRVFAWDVLDELVRMQGLSAVRAWVRPRVAWWLRPYLAIPLTDDEPVFTERDLAFGLIDRHAHWTEMQRTIENDVIPGFQKRGLLEDAATRETLLVEFQALNGRPPS